MQHRAQECIRSKCHFMTTETGVLVVDNQNGLTSGPYKPILSDDQLRDKWLILILRDAFL